MKNLIAVLLVMLAIALTACKKSKDTAPPPAANCTAYSLEGVWTRTANGPNGSPGCLGERIDYKNNFGQGIVLSEPSGCPFIVGSVKWRNMNATNCNIENSYTAVTPNTFEFRSGNIKFTTADKVEIHGETYTK
jgi:hypothetical protein